MRPQISGQARNKKRLGTPLRTCLGCGKKAPKSSLARFVWHNLQLHRDQKGVMKGRGVYACNNNQCPTLLANDPKKLARSLRQPEIKTMAKPLVISEGTASAHRSRASDHLLKK